MLPSAFRIYNNNKYENRLHNTKNYIADSLPPRHFPKSLPFPSFFSYLPFFTIYNNNNTLLYYHYYQEKGFAADESKKTKKTTTTVMETMLPAQCPCEVEKFPGQTWPCPRPTRPQSFFFFRSFFWVIYFGWLLLIGREGIVVSEWQTVADY
jgi:hypothetical protein